MGKVLKYLAGIILISVFVVGGYYWVQGREPVAAGYALVNVERDDIVEKAVAVGQIEPRMEFHIKSKISGIVRRCYVEVGDAVAPGDPLFEIEPDPTPIELVEAERQVESRESAFRRAQADWKRTSELASQGVISGDEVDAARETFELARIGLDRASDGLALLREGRIAGRGHRLESIIRAPAEGIVLARRVNPGDPVVPLTSRLRVLRAEPPLGSCQNAASRTPKPACFAYPRFRVLRRGTTTRADRATSSGCAGSSRRAGRGRHLP